MVLVVLTRAGYDDMRQLISPTGCPVWVNADVVSEGEIKELRRDGVNLTTFSSRIDPWDDAQIGAVVAIVAEHHPDDPLDRISVPNNTILRQNGTYLRGPVLGG